MKETKMEIKKKGENVENNNRVEDGVRHKLGIKFNVLFKIIYIYCFVKIFMKVSF